MGDVEVRDNQGENRYEAIVDGMTAVLDYRLQDGGIRLVHTGVPGELEGRGVGSALARHALDDARQRGLAVWPQCPFVASYIRRHPEYLDLVDPDYPRHELES